MLKVIGAGFARTGTRSLKAALETLGVGPCYHAVDMFARPDDIRVWARAVDGEPVDFATLFANWSATVDFPGCAFYQDLMKVYPDAKVLLSVRDPERWYESCAATVFERWIDPKPVSDEHPWLPVADKLISERIFQNRIPDRAFAIEVFNRHNDAVKATVPAEKLLVFDVKQGWEPLCEFLDVAVPTDQPFPHLNDTASFLKEFHKEPDAPSGQ